MAKKIPVGIWNFREIIEGDYYYVDKSLLIKEIAESGKVVLMTRPRRFGKTLNLSMLQYFYEKTELSTAHLFEGLAIWEDEEFRSLQGQFPVIFVTFKDIFQSTYEEMIKKFAFIIAGRCVHLDDHPDGGVLRAPAVLRPRADRRRREGVIGQRLTPALA